MAIILSILSNQYWTLFPIMYSLHLSIHSKDQRIQKVVTYPLSQWFERISHCFHKVPVKIFTYVSLVLTCCHVWIPAFFLQRSSIQRSNRSPLLLILWSLGQLLTLLLVTDVIWHLCKCTLVLIAYIPLNSPNLKNKAKQKPKEQQQKNSLAMHRKEFVHVLVLEIKVRTLNILAALSQSTITPIQWKYVCTERN